LSSSQPFSTQTVFEIHEAGNVAARPSQVVDEAGSDRIGNTVEHNRNRLSLPLQRRHAQGARSEDDMRRECNQFRCVCALAFDVVLAPACVDLNIAAVGPAQLLQDLLERRESGLTIWIIRDRVHQHADPPHLLGLLRPGTKRPCGRHAADERDELAPLQPIELHL
jgi:hypothetical protein